MTAETKETLNNRQCLVWNRNNFEGVATIIEVISITSKNIIAKIKFDGIEKSFIRKVKLLEVLS